MNHQLLIPRRRSGFSPLSFGSDLALWLDPSYGVYTDRSTLLAAASSQYWSVASNASIQTGDIDFWFGVWIKTTANTVYVFSKGIGDNEHVLYIDAAGKPAWLCGPSGTTVTHSTAINDGAWRFVIVYHDSVNDLLGVSVDGGAFQTTAMPVTITAGATAFVVGGTAGVYFDGQVDSVMFGKSPVGGIAALATTIRDYLYNSGSGRVYADLSAAQATAWGLVSAWDFDGDGLDSHGTNDLTAVNSPTYTTGIASGVAGDGDLVSLIVPRAGPNLVPPSYAGRPTWYANGGKPYLSFDGVNDGLQTASNISLGAFTIGGNFYASGTAGILVEHSANGGLGNGSFVYGTTGATVFVNRGTKDGRNLTANWAVDSTWRTICHCSNGTHATNSLRLNGVDQSLADTVDIGDTGTATVADKLNVGCRNQASLFSTMRIGDLVAINANLSAAQLAQLEPWLIARRSA